MDFKQKKVLEEKSRDISRNISLYKIKPLLIEFKIFNKYMWDDINSVSDVFELLPYRGPNAFQKFIHILRKSKYDDEADCLENTAIFMKSPYKLEYKMSSYPLGYCLIINNVNFAYTDDRLGSDEDAKFLKNFFFDIDYKVFCERNMKAAEMSLRLHEFSRYDFQNVDSSIVIILSHGGNVCNQDVIYGTDGLSILKSDIVDIFSNKCQHLQGKPKIFFFVSGRENIESKLATSERMDSISSRVVNADTVDSICGEGEAESMDSIDIIPTSTDILIIHSCLPYHKLKLDPVRGSWFCQDLISVLKKYYCIYDLETILKIVNSKLVERKSALEKENNGVSKRIMLCRHPIN